ncbi:MAG: hypothetical protein ACSNEK_03070 [Parachlamydiaceae bacterium]
MSTIPNLLHGTGEIPTRREKKKKSSFNSVSDGNISAISRDRFSPTRIGSAIIPSRVPPLNLPPKPSMSEEEWTPKSARNPQEEARKTDKTPRSACRIRRLFTSPKQEKFDLPPLLKNNKQVKRVAKQIKHVFAYMTAKEQPFDPSLFWRKHSIGLFLRLLEGEEPGDHLEKTKEDFWQELKSDLKKMIFHRLEKLVEILEKEELNQTPRHKEVAQFLKELTEHSHNLLKADVIELFSIQNPLVKTFFDDLLKTEQFKNFFQDIAEGDDQEINEICELAHAVGSLSKKRTAKMDLTRIGGKEIRKTYTQGKKENHLSTILLETLNGDTSSIHFEKFDGCERSASREKGSSIREFNCRYREGEVSFYRSLISDLIKGGIVDPLSERSIGELIYYHLLGQGKYTFFIETTSDTDIYPIISLLKSTTHTLLSNFIGQFKQDYYFLLKNFNADLDLASKQVKITAVEKGFITEQSLTLKAYHPQSPQEPCLNFRLSYYLHFNNDKGWYPPKFTIRLEEADFLERHQNSNFSFSELKKIIREFIVVMGNGLNTSTSSEESLSAREQENSPEYTPEPSLIGPSDTDSVDGSTEADSDEEAHHG